MRTCVACTRWRPISDYGASESHAPDRCVPCRRAETPDWAPTPAQQQLFPRHRNRVAAGSAVWTHDIAWWLREKADEHGWDQLALWGECGERTLRRAQTGEARILDIGILDRVVLREGSTSLAELCPLAA